VGLVDDVFGLKPWHKFGVEVLAGMLVVFGGIQVHLVPDASTNSVLGAIATVLWLVACTNAVNLIDGLDGLASGVTLIATVTIAGAAVLAGDTGLAMASAPLVATLVGFLLFNSNPASIFLGDSGSLVLGFLLGCFSIVWANHTGSVTGMAAPLLALAIPLIDTALAISRRFLSGKPIFLPDRSHIHHRLLARGLSHRKAVLSLYLAGLTAGSFSLGLACVPDVWKVLVLVAFLGAAISGIRLLAYAEFEAAGQLIAPKSFRRQITAHVALRQFAQDLSQAETPDACWVVIDNASQEFGLHLARMYFGDQVFRSPRAVNHLFQLVMRIPISNEQWVELLPDSSQSSYTNAAVPFADTIQKILADKSSKMTLSRNEQIAHRQPHPGIVTPVLTQHAV
jgi:UDP-GlcNAc:undecaprenyl-phosphate GlcNAc-1-phosphate transferase